MDIYTEQLLKLAEAVQQLTGILKEMDARISVLEGQIKEIKNEPDDEKEDEEEEEITNGIESLEEVMAEKERFAKLAETASLDVFKSEAAKYFDAKEKKYADAIDNEWGDTLIIACEMQKRIKIRRERMEAATSPKEAYYQMFSPV